MVERMLLMTMFAGVAFAAESSYGALITFEFTGTVTSVRDDGPYLDGSIVPGADFSGTYAFESSTPRNPLGEYIFSSPDCLMTLRIGNYDLVAPLDFIFVDNGDKDGYQVRSTPFALGMKQAVINFFYVDLTGTVFDSDALPIVPPDMTRFDFGHFVFGSTDGGSFGVDGQITSITPEPHSLAFALIGALVVCIGKRKH